ncbi:unnamed protein product [Pleuronectes platessa]|uniref:Uncharacterized protein n=1 Tax=Pleuronectes platessa TaxID=8262 RepID=A0A9N7TNS3_PLEPL|nr:unnamed protein product [Pleuronectes platessa]
MKKLKKSNRLQTPNWQKSGSIFTAAVGFTTRPNLKKVGLRPAYETCLEPGEVQTRGELRNVLRTTLELPHDVKLTILITASHGSQLTWRGRPRAERSLELTLKKALKPTNPISRVLLREEEEEEEEEEPSSPEALADEPSVTGSADLRSVLDVSWSLGIGHRAKTLTGKQSLADPSITRITRLMGDLRFIRILHGRGRAVRAELHMSAHASNQQLPSCEAQGWGGPRRWLRSPGWQEPRTISWTPPGSISSPCSQESCCDPLPGRQITYLLESGLRVSAVRTLVCQEPLRPNMARDVSPLRLMSTRHRWVGASLDLVLPLVPLRPLVFYYFLSCAAATASLPGIEYSYGMSPKFVCTPIPPEADPSCYSPPAVPHGPSTNGHTNGHSGGPWRGMMSDEAKATILHLRESLVRQKETILDQRETIRELTAKLTLCEGFGGGHHSGGHHDTRHHNNHDTHHDTNHDNHHDTNHDTHHDTNHDNHRDNHHEGDHDDDHRGTHGSHHPSTSHHGPSSYHGSDHHYSHGSHRPDPHHRKGPPSSFSPEQTGKTLQTLKERLENLQETLSFSPLSVSGQSSNRKLLRGNSSSSYSSSLRELLAEEDHRPGGAAARLPPGTPRLTMATTDHHDDHRRHHPTLTTTHDDHHRRPPRQQPP